MVKLWHKQVLSKSYQTHPFLWLSCLESRLRACVERYVTGPSPDLFFSLYQWHYLPLTVWVRLRILVLTDRRPIETRWIGKKASPLTKIININLSSFITQHFLDNFWVVTVIICRTWTKFLISHRNKSFYILPKSPSKSVSSYGNQKRQRRPWHNRLMALAIFGNRSSWDQSWLLLWCFVVKYVVEVMYRRVSGKLFIT